jgi:EmrB/QacA subfamily drug resistance transporter
VERKWWTLVAVCVGVFMLLIDITVVNVALPSIQKSLHASFTDLQWVVDAYALALATFVLTAGSAGDLFGRKRVFMTGIVLFTSASALCGAAPDPLFLNVSRGIQGLGGAIMFATSLALLSQEFHGRERGTAFGIWGATTGAAVAIGPLVGGMLTSWLSWRWIFFVNVPIGIFAFVLSARVLHESSDPEHGSIDPLGLALLIGGLFTLVFALIEGNDRGWSSTLIISLLIASAVLLLGFALQQLRRRVPMIDLRLFRKPAFTGVQIAAFAISASLFSMFLYLTLYMQQVLGFSPIAAGVRFLPMSLLAFVAAPIGGKLSERVPVRFLMGGGLALCAISMALMAGLTPSSEWTALLAGFVVGGIGIGLTNPALASTAIATVPREQAGAASGVNSTFRQVGIATGIAALGAIFQHQIASTLGGSGSHSFNGATGPVPEPVKAAFISALNDILWVGTGIAAIGALLALVLVRRRDLVPSGRPATTH